MVRTVASPSLAFVLAICASVPVLVAGVRDENEASYQTARNSGTRALHVRVDGKQTKLKSFALSPDSPGDVPQDPAPDSKAITSKDVEGEVKREVARFEKRETFAQSIDPRRGAPMILLFWVMLMGGLFVGLMSIVRAMRRRSGSSEVNEEGQKQGPGIESGTVLVCICRDEGETGELAKVYAGIPPLGSSEVLRQVQFGAKVTVTGKPVFVEVLDCMMVPIQPEGAVQLTQFAEEKAVSIDRGTIITCNRTLDSADVFSSVASNFVIGKIEKGERVVAIRPPEWCQGWAMVPIRPRGAVELEFFDAAPAVVGEAPEPEDSEAMASWAKAEIEAEGEINAKLKVLRLQKGKMMMEQAVKKKKLEEVIEEMLETEAELQGKVKPTDAEIRRAAEKTLANADMAAHKHVLMAVAYASPIVTQSQRIYQAVEQSAQKARDKTSQIVLEESKNALKELQDVFGVEDLEALHSIDGVNIPSVAAILACVFAPVQLRFLYSLNFTFCAMSVANVVMDIGVLSFDWNTPCNSIPLAPPALGAPLQQWAKIWWQDTLSSPVHMWFLCDCVVHVGCAIARAPIVLRLGRILEFIRQPPPTDSDLDPIEVLKTYYHFYTTDGTNALLEMDAVSESSAVFLANWSVFFDMCWLFYGTDLVWNTPWHICHTAGIAVLRLRVTIFQVLFMVYAFQLVIAISHHMLHSEKFAVTLIDLADKLDKQFFATGLPIMKVVCHALIVRRSSDMIAIQLNMQQNERSRLKEQKDIAIAKLERITHSYDATEQAIEKLAHEQIAAGSLWKDEAAMQEQYEKMHSKIKEDSADFAEKVRVRSVKATEEAEKRLEEWERGEGGELVEAFVKGEGMAKVGEMMSKADAALQEEAQAAADNAAEIGAGLSQAAAASAAATLEGASSVSSPSVAEVVAGASGTAAAAAAQIQPAATRPSQAATGAAAPPEAEGAGGGPRSSTAAAASTPPAATRPSQADGGAG